MLAAESRRQLRRLGKLIVLSQDRTAASQLTSLTYYKLGKIKKVDRIGKTANHNTNYSLFLFGGEEIGHYTREKRPNKFRMCQWSELQRTLGRKTDEEKLCELCCAVKEKAQNKIQFSK